jgi:putative copper export protein
MFRGLSMWDSLALVAAIIGLILAGWFVVQYQRQVGWDWWRNPFGRFLMTRKLMLVLLFGNAIVNRLIINDETWRQASSAVLLTLFAVQTLVPYRLLMKAQRDMQDHKEARQ